MKASSFVKRLKQGTKSLALLCHVASLCGARYSPSLLSLFPTAYKLWAGPGSETCQAPSLQATSVLPQGPQAAPPQLVLSRIAATALWCSLLWPSSAAEPLLETHL